MDSSASPEPILQQVEPLKKELKECKKTKEHLQYSELKYRNLVESANEAILVAQNGIFQYANPKAEALFGYSHGQGARGEQPHVVWTQFGCDPAGH